MIPPQNELAQKLFPLPVLNIEEGGGLFWEKVFCIPETDIYLALKVSIKEIGWMEFRTRDAGAEVQQSYKRKLSKNKNLKKKQYIGEKSL